MWLSCGPFASVSLFVSLATCNQVTGKKMTFSRSKKSVCKRAEMEFLRYENFIKLFVGRREHAYCLVLIGIVSTV